MEPAPRLRPPLSGWFMLSLVVATLVLQQLAFYLGRAPAVGAPDISDLDQRVRLAVAGSEFRPAILKLSRAKATDLEAARANAKREKVAELKKILQDVEPYREQDLSYRLMSVVLRNEIGQNPDPKDLKLLAEDDGPRRRAAAKIYAAEKLTREQAVAWSKPFTGEFFVDKLVRYHAMAKAGNVDARHKDFEAHAVRYGVVGLFAMCAFLLGGALLIGYGGAKLSGKLPMLGHPAGNLDEHEADANAWRTSWMLVALFGGQIVVMLALSAFEWPAELKGLISFGISIALMSLILKTPIHGRTMSLERLGIHRRDLGKNVLWGVGAAVANIPLLLIAAMAGQWIFRSLPEARHPIQDVIGGATPWTLVALFAAAAILAPIFEETVFRGTLLPALVSRLGGVRAGILVSGLAFAAIHPTGLPAWPALALVGIVAAVVTLQTRSLVPAIVMHAVHNGSILIISTTILN